MLSLTYVNFKSKLQFRIKLRLGLTETTMFKLPIISRQIYQLKYDYLMTK